MALAETVIRLIHKHQVIPKAVRYLPVILFLVAMALVVWLAVLPLEGQYRRTYISENALMPGQVTLYFRESEWNYVRGFRSELVNMEQMDYGERQLIVQGWLDDIGLTTDIHHNSVNSTTLYGVMHAPRGDDTEAVVLTVPWYTSDGHYNVGALALGMALMRYFLRMLIWSRNIVVVFPELLRVPLRQWVDAYHTLLPLNAGAIDAAIVMEYASANDHFDYYQMFYEGLNGQLPNLDLLNTANTVGYHENIHVSIQDTPNLELTKNTYYSRLRTLIRGIVHLAVAGLTPQTSKGCEAFSGWLIQAFTIRAVGDEGHDITQFGRIVDQTFRSVNNLLEKFHQSFFFYFLLLRRNFVLIGTYLPAAVFLAVAYALALLVALLGSQVLVEAYFSHITTTLTGFTSIMVFSWTMSVVLPWIAQSGGIVAAQLLLVVGIVSGVVLSLAPVTRMVPILISRPTQSSIIGLSLFYISMLITALLIVHFALALLVGLVALPLIFVAPIINQGPLTSKDRIRIACCLAVSNPFVAIGATGWFTGEGGAVLLRGLLTAWSEVQCWTWYVVVLGWLPGWLGMALAAAVPTPIKKTCPQATKEAKEAKEGKEAKKVKAA